MTSFPVAPRLETRRLQRAALGVGLAVLVVCVIGAFFSPAQFYRAYLVSYLFYLGIAHGCLAILMLYYLTGGAWGFLIRRVLEAGMRTLPLLAVLFLPIAWGIGTLFPWAQANAAANESIRHKEIYLNAGFFWIRAVIYFVLWVGMAWLLSRWSREQDRTGDPRMAARMTRLSGPGLAVFGVTVTFAVYDWIMSLQPAFRSTIFGPWFASGELLSAQAGALVVLGWLLCRTSLAEVASVEALNDLGNLLLSFLVIWAYMTFFQFMLIWIADLPYDVSWYMPRGVGGWLYVAWAVFIFQFSIPFFFLLMRDVKRSPRALAATAAVILLMNLVFTYYQVMPSFVEATDLGEHWMDFLTPVALGGLWLAFFLWQLERYPLLAQHDASRASALHLRELDVEQAAREEAMHHA